MSNRLNSEVATLAGRSRLVNAVAAAVVAFAFGCFPPTPPTSLMVDGPDENHPSSDVGDHESSDAGSDGGETADASVPRLDPAFGIGGIAEPCLIQTTYRSFALASDGALVVLGERGSELVLVRYTAEGRLDATFGTVGCKVISSLRLSASKSVMVQPDGRIVVGVTELRENDSNWIRIMRFHDDGRPDESFGDEGSFVFRPSKKWFLGRLALLPEGTIFAAGSAQGESERYNSSTFLMRVDADGALDERFGVGGVAIERSTVGASGLVVQPNGRILVATGLWVIDDKHGLAQTFSNVAIVGFDANGVLDIGFGVDGVATIQGDVLRAESFVDLVMQPGGELVAVGYSFQYDAPDLEDAIVARFTVDGEPDASFGDGGIVRFDVFEVDVATSLALSPAGQIVVGGSQHDYNNEFQTGWLARLLPNGAFDSDFGDGGLHLVTGGGLPSVQSLMFQDDMLLVVKRWSEGQTWQRTVARYFQ